MCRPVDEVKFQEGAMERVERKNTNLGGSNTNFGTSVDVNTTMSVARECGTNSVHDSNTKSSTIHAVSQGEDGVRGFAALAQEDAHIVTEDGGLPVEEVAGQFDADWDLGEFLENRPGGQA